MPEEPIDSEQSKVTPAPPESRRTIGIQSLGRSLGSVLDVGRELLARKRVVRSVQVPEGSGAALVGACQDLLEHRGEPSGLALASEVVQAYRSLPETERFFFFASLAQEFSVDRERVLAAFEQYRQEDRVEHLWAVSRAVEAPRQKLFRRINMAPDGTRTLVELRGHLLPLLKAHPELKAIDVDLRQLFISWFNKGWVKTGDVSRSFILHYTMIHWYSWRSP
jgi:malonyl-CoA decarboxylase